MPRKSLRSEQITSGWVPEIRFDETRRAYLRLRGLPDDAISRLERILSFEKPSFDMQATSPTPGQTREDLLAVAHHADEIARLLKQNGSAEAELAAPMHRAIGSQFATAMPKAMSAMARAARARADALPAQGRGGLNYAFLLAKIEGVTEGHGIVTKASGAFALIVDECFTVAGIEKPKGGVASRIRTYLKSRPPKAGS